MNIRLFAIASILTSSLFTLKLAIPTPSAAQSNLNASLNQALCQQNWAEALRILEEIKRVAPEHAPRLTVYQSRLQVLANRGIYRPDWNCNGGSLPSASQPEPTPTETGNVYTIPILGRASGIPVVEVKFNDQETYRMMFDTGASKTKILPSMARSLNLQAEGEGVVAVADGRFIAVKLGRLESVTVGNLTVENIEVTYTEDANEIGLSGMGLLGQNVFGQYDVTIKENVIELRERS